MFRKCWCGGSDLMRSFRPDYYTCMCCGTFVSQEKCVPEDVYEFGEYWHGAQARLGFPPIEGRAKSDFKDRIPLWYNTIAELPGRKESILEVGCAHGGFLAYCRDRGFKRYVGVEVDPKTCEFAKKQFGLDEVYPGLFPEVDISGFFDFVVGFDVLEHFPDPLYALFTMRELTNPGGYIVIQTPWYCDEGRAFRHFKADEHLFIFTDAAMRKLLWQAGLREISLKRGVFNQDMTVVATQS